MRSCPYCQTWNTDAAAVCVRCGQSLYLENIPEDPAPTEPTRPVMVRHTSPNYPAVDAEPHSYNPGYEQQPHRVPGTTKARQSPWLLLFAGLGVMLTLALGMALFTWLFMTRSIATGLGMQILNPPGQVLAEAKPTNPAPAGAPSNFVPSPWPTFTPTPSGLLKKTSTPNPTQSSVADKLLSPSCKSSLDELSKVSDLLKTDPSKVLDASWRGSVDQATADMKTNCGTLESASPIPGQLGMVQTSLNQATSEFDQAKLLWQQGIDQRDPGKLLSAATHFSEATKQLGQAMSQMQAIIPK